MILYKYMRREHASLLLEKGTIRIGTLYEYRNTEEHGSVIGDPEEGIKTEFMEVGKEVWTEENQPEFSKSLIKVSGPGSHNISNFTLEKGYHSPDCYLFCTTETFDEAAMEDFEYDTCVVIEDAERFFWAIAETIKDKAEYIGAGRCQYTERRKHHAVADDINPGLIKSPEYERQREVRAIWMPKSESISPMIIECPDAAKYCKLYS